jgi:hypothetical protein
MDKKEYQIKKQHVIKLNAFYNKIMNENKNNKDVKTNNNNNTSK